MNSLNELTVRPEHGSDPLRFVKWRGSRQDYNSSHLVILIHGFNNSEEKARSRYQEFLWKLEHPPTYYPLPEYFGKFLGTFWGFYWPGDHPSRLVGIAAAPMVYAMRKGNAFISGQSLGELLMRLSPRQEVVLVGHSMGCRVLLEALAHYSIERRKGRRGGVVTAVCLMAAAVSIMECEGSEKPYRRRPEEPPKEREIALYSSRDMVLRPGFKVGEWFYDSKDGPAVGASGLPTGRWSDQSIDTTLGHGLYWEHQTSVELVANFITETPATGRTSRTGPEEASWEQPHRDRDVREIITREIGDGQILRWRNCFDPS